LQLPKPAAATDQQDSGDWRRDLHEMYKSAEGGYLQMLGRVLLADDHPEVRKTIRGLLTEVSLGICGEAKNGREAIDMASELQPDLIVLDLVMPEMNGLEAAYEIRQYAPSSKIILLSLHYPPQDGVAFAKALGADAFLHKSALADDLVPTIGRLLSMKLAKKFSSNALLAETIPQLFSRHKNVN
jgi:DNA-binding NarL/FixJ family response regulator